MTTDMTPEGWARYLACYNPDMPLRAIRLELDAGTGSILPARRLTQLATQVLAAMQALKS